MEIRNRNRKNRTISAHSEQAGRGLGGLGTLKRGPSIVDSVVLRCMPMECSAEDDKLNLTLAQWHLCYKAGNMWGMEWWWMDLPDFGP